MVSFTGFYIENNPSFGFGWHNELERACIWNFNKLIISKPDCSLTSLYLLRIGHSRAVYQVSVPGPSDAVVRKVSHEKKVAQGVSTVGIRIKFVIIQLFFSSAS